MNGTQPTVESLTEAFLAARRIILNYDKAVNILGQHCISKEIRQAASAALEHTSDVETVDGMYKVLISQSSTHDKTPRMAEK